MLIVSLGSTGGLRAADEELLASLHRAGASAAIARARPPRALRTLMLTDLAWALSARRAAREALAREPARALIYSTTTAALFWPRPGAIRFDALAAANRLGRHGLWQRPLERRRLRQAPLLLPQSEGALAEAPGASQRGVGDEGVLVLPVPVPVEALGVGTVETPSAVAVAPGAERECAVRIDRDIAAITYAANPTKKGLGILLAAWARVRRVGEDLYVAGVSEDELRALGYELPAEGVRVTGLLPAQEYRTLLRRARAYVCAARREDYGIAQLEALADGCMLVTVPSPGPYAALPLARQLDGRLVGEDIGVALRTALDDPAPAYAERARAMLEPYRREAVDRIVAEELLTRLIR